ncbi:uncharacterized protein NP_5338A [Natronomonas pharaonis DSM 2160]|uniref:Uncharacterized protein n=1 Tax=Natronomonas pharaonis (strain ATCC 35678 / DSM 2160 / CIP 103997 / JCM 8858 / NBRC 14720 / NCIMB 2260 / Gabara) TaxID=348780 RepID=A0A1U7EZN0_NATPD|nr:hypothetical protein [Natronomonas pharaonis]CAI50760.1 uncharacterized protein NP_5338A [Natronomonas pharaonis DSM 2160]
MSTIVTKKVDGYGPYAYRVTYTGDGHHWEYLGPAGKVDPAELTDKETAELRAEGFALARYRETTTAEFGDLETANAVRDELPDGVLAPTDDRRDTTIEVLGDELDADERAYLEGAAADSKRRETYQHGQAELTDAERRDVDPDNLMHARSAKAILQGEGVDDWRAYYDPELTPSEHVDVAERARRDESGARADREGARETRRAADQFRAAQGAMADHAREACREGHEEACAELREMGIEPPEPAGV